MAKLIDVDKNVGVVQASIDHPCSGTLIVGVWEKERITLLRTDDEKYITSGGETFFEDDIKVVKILGDCVFSIYE